VLEKKNVKKRKKKIKEDKVEIAGKESTTE